MKFTEKNLLRIKQVRQVLSCPCRGMTKISQVMFNAERGHYALVGVSITKLPCDNCKQVIIKLERLFFNKERKKAIHKKKIADHWESSMTPHAMTNCSTCNTPMANYAGRPKGPFKICRCGDVKVDLRGI